MSDQATDLAIQQRGLHPAAKLGLWHLCNRHTLRSGCFPSQDQLTADTEISRASLNTQLRRLEAAGLIRRQRRTGRGPKQWKSTRYILGFEADFPQKPSPDSGRKSGQKPSPDLAQMPEKPTANNLFNLNDKCRFCATPDAKVFSDDRKTLNFDIATAAVDKARYRNISPRFQHKFCRVLIYNS